MESVQNNSNFQEVIYERLQEEILHGKYPGGILSMVHAYNGRINKAIFEGVDWKNLGGTLMHCLMGRMTWVQLDYFDLPYPDLGELKYLIATIRHILDVYDPDLAIKDKEGKTMLDKREHFIKEYDWILRSLMFEPRGHDIMSGSFLYEPSSDEYDIGILFIETSGCLPMCGHGTIGTVTMMIQEGLVKPKNEGIVVLETPAGRVDAYYTLNEDKVTSVKIVNVPSFLYALSITSIAIFTFCSS